MIVRLKSQRRSAQGKPSHAKSFGAGDSSYFCLLFLLKLTKLPPTIQIPSYAYTCSRVSSSVCLSDRITSSHPTDRQLSRLTFSDQGEEHSEISIRLPSPVSIVCVTPPPPCGISPPSHSKLEPFGIQIAANSSDLLEQ